MGKDKKKSIGVDIGGTKIAIAAVENDGKLLASTIIPTEADKKFNMALERIGATIEMYKRQDGRGAKKIIERTLHATSTAAWTFLHTFMPESIIIGGGIGEQHFDLFAQCFQKAIKEATMIPSDGIKILKAQMGNQAGVVGAAYLPRKKRH